MTKIKTQATIYPDNLLINYLRKKHQELIQRIDLIAIQTLQVLQIIEDRKAFYLSSNNFQIKSIF